MSRVGYSCWLLGWMVPSRHVEDLVLAQWALLGRAGRGAPGAGMG